jgi:hypothetical protein
MHGGNWFDDVLGGIKSVAEKALPIAMHIAPMLGLGHHRKGGAEMGHHHLNPHMQSYSGENSTTWGITEDCTRVVTTCGVVDGSAE